MTKANQLLRRPRPPKLYLIDLTHVDEGTPLPTALNESSDESSCSNTPSDDRELLVPSLRRSEVKTATTNLPILTPKNTQLAFKNNYPERLDSTDRQYLDASDRFFRARTETKTINYDEEDKNALNFKLLSRTTYKRLLSMSPPKQETSTINFSVEKSVQKIKPFNMIREYSKFKDTRNPQLKPYKALGPDPLPMRQPKHFTDKRKNYENLSYYEDLKQVTFTLNDFILGLNGEFDGENKKLIKSILSTKHYKGFCKAIAEKLYRDLNKNNDKVNDQSILYAI